MKTPATMTRLSASCLEMVPAATQSATALATAFWAGPNICAAWPMPLIVTLVMSTVAGLQTRFGVSTANKLVCPCDWLASALAKAVPTGPSFEPISKSMWAISLPSPHNASPMNIDIARSPVRSSRVLGSMGLTICEEGACGKREKSERAHREKKLPLGAPLTLDAVGIAGERSGSERATREGRPVGVTAAVVPGDASLVQHLH